MSLRQPFRETSEDVPVAEKIPALCEAHGTTWSDNYAWLRANYWQAAMREPEAFAGYANTADRIN